jgi:hypothetical protein
MSTSHALGVSLEYTEEEKRNIALCQEYMSIAYDPQRASAAAVSHLCTSSSEFIGQSTFPAAESVPDYAEVHAEVMKSINDLKLLQYDVVIAKQNLVTLRYTASGSHSGQPWHGVAGNGQKATWHAVVIFEIDAKQGKISKVTLARSRTEERQASGSYHMLTVSPSLCLSLLVRCTRSGTRR